MKTTLLLILLAIQLHAAPADTHTTPREKQLIQAVYNRWTIRWGGTPRSEKPSTALHMMLGIAQGYGLTAAEQRLLRRIETLIKSRL